MSDYSEHLVSMAGGDGDEVDEDQRELKNIAAMLNLLREREALRLLVDEQAATLAAVLELANSAGRCGWKLSADDVRKALRG